MNRSEIHRRYKSYSIVAFTHRFKSDWVAANVLLVRHASSADLGGYRFYAIDYFDTEELALSFAQKWARNWIDCRG